MRSRSAHAGLESAMQESLAGALRDRRPQVRHHWEALLRVEPVGTPLGHPDSLVHLIDWTLDEIYTALTHPLSRKRAGHHRSLGQDSAGCACGGNPLLRYFAAGEQAMREALVLSQVALLNLEPLERDASFEELNLVLQEISRREIAAFCSVCGQRQAGLRVAPTSGNQQAPEGLGGI